MTRRPDQLDSSARTRDHSPALAVNTHQQGKASTMHNVTETTTTITGPDLTRCGSVIDWQDRVGLLDEFKNAAATAVEMLEFDIELARWSVDAPLAAQYVQWWNNQRAMLRRHMRAQLAETHSFVVHRRTDQGDGFVKCYVRVEGGELS